MSLRRKHIKIPAGVNVNLIESVLIVKGKQGKLELDIPTLVLVRIENEIIDVNPKKLNSKKSRSLSGLICKEIANALIGVQEKIEYRLILVGVGYKAQIQKNELELSLGFSHPNIILIPDELDIKVEKNTEIIIEGLSKNCVGRLASQIRRLRSPEPYKGKGVLYKGEKILLKAGKSGKK
uniref:ribosomal protein L6 n=1 Tax=Haramonas pauciplastida TaxID=478668 RepID=UPI0021145EF3|nr:ribosomal protein L6 [Haramonas pauciplastida]UTE94967.1 ribosomal protein L6 [Haramonas pauciplastida]